MFFVYCLLSEKVSKFHYYGFTSNMEQRLQYHQKGKVKTTKRFLPLKLLGYKVFENEIEALKFEKD
ncbi:MAG: GIY-YIG nuclease family protein [Candidatus Dojkabacteria bacterium]